MHAGIPGPNVPPALAGPAVTAQASADLADVDVALAELPALALADQVAVFTDIHRRLAAALAVTAQPASSPGDQLRAR